MKHTCAITLAMILFLAACGPSGGSSASNGTPSLLPARCGNAICESGENTASCPVDCPSAAFSGRVETTYINSPSIGNIAVMVASPQTPRFTDGAGVVVVVPPVFSQVDGFMTDPDLTSLGLVQVSFLWPGMTDDGSGMRSEGEFDYGGPNSVQVLRDVLRYASARKADVNNRYVVAITFVPPLTDEVGLYAFGDAGIPAVNVLAQAEGQLQNLQYYVGRENPTVDTITCAEIGYYTANGQPAYNPFYLFPSSFGFDRLTLNFSNLRWDPDYEDSSSPFTGRPFLDLDGNGTISGTDFIFNGQIPVMSGRRYYSAALTQALVDNRALLPSNWPDDLATPQQAASTWQTLQDPSQFADLKDDEFMKDLKVMLVFAQNDHAQVAQDKPHIHQAFQGFRFQAGLWVRLNPDRAYVQAMLQEYTGTGVPATQAAPANAVAALNFPDNPANTQPTDWIKIDANAYPGLGEAGRLLPLAAVAEMADRAHENNWNENVGQALYFYTPATPQP